MMNLKKMKKLKFRRKSRTTLVKNSTIFRWMKRMNKGSHP